MRLNELFDKGYPYTLYFDGPAAYADVELPDDSDFEVTFDMLSYAPEFGDELEETGGEWTVTFHRDGEWDASNKGDQYRIFATVLTVIGEFLRKKDPDVLSFDADKGNMHARDPDRNSRVNLYDRMVKRFASKFHYKLERNELEHRVEYIFKNSSPVEESVLTELFDSGYPFELVHHNDTSSFAHIRLPDKTKIEVVIDRWSRNSPKWEVAFTRGGRFSVSDAGDQFRVFATVIEVIKQFIKDRNPESLEFTADKDTHHYGKERDNRASLYDRMVKRFVSSSGYDIKREELPGAVYYTLIRKGAKDV